MRRKRALQTFKGGIVCQHNGQRYRNNECADCSRARAARHRRRQRLGLALLKACEDRGLSGGEALALLQNASYRELQRCQSEGIK